MSSNNNFTNLNARDLYEYLSVNIDGNIMDQLLNNAFVDSINIGQEITNYINSEEENHIELDDEIITQNRFVNFNTFNSFNILNYLLYDPIEEVMNQSLNEQSDGLVKTDNIININSIVYETVEQNIRKDNILCSICMSDFANTDNVSFTKCKHLFHTDCIVEWGKYKTICPICREKLE